MNKAKTIWIVALLVLVAAAAVSLSLSQCARHTESPTPTTTPAPPPAATGGMVQIPGGSFIMGCVDGDSQCDNDEKPAHRVTLNSFYMDVHEVTVAEYSQCVSAGVCKAARAETNVLAEFYNSNHADRENHPVNGVSWNDAHAYCNWRQKRLPTEAEFEYALRGGSQGYIYPWGNNNTPPQGFGNYADKTYSQRFPKASKESFRNYTDGYVGTSPVCSFTRNVYGLCDISGNVWEWCADWHNNLQDPTAGDFRTSRGGGFVSGLADRLRASFRGYIGPGIENTDVGFRCVRD